MTIVTKLIEYKDGEFTLEGFLALDDAKSGPRPVVLVSHDYSGRGPFACDRAEDLAKLGYTGFALDLYGKGKRGSSSDENRKLMKPFLDDRKGLLLRRLNLALDVVKKEPTVDSNKVAAIGYCFGGLCVLDLARSGCDIRGVVSLHGILSSPPGDDTPPIKAKILILHGHNDPLVSPEAAVACANDLTKRGADWQLHGYGNACHAFTNPGADAANMEGVKYSPTADRRSWQSTRNFLEECFE